VPAPAVQKNPRPGRLVFLWFLFAVALGVVLHRLWVLQVGAGPAVYQQHQDRQSVRSVRLPGTRGRILDRNGIPLAENRPSYCISLYLEELRRPGPVSKTVDAVMDTIYRLAETLDIPPALTPQDVRLHLRRRTPLPLVAWRDLPPAPVARYAEHAAAFPGVALTVEPVRVYPHGPLAAHLLGYVGRADIAAETAARAEADPDAPPPEKIHFYLPEMAGKSGIEKKLDGLLRANEGGKLEIQIDVAGFKFDEVSRRPPSRGADVTLAVDSRIQRALEDVLSTPLPGEENLLPSPIRAAGVVVDPRNGDILAMASLPAFDPNRFVPAIPAPLWRALQADPARPLYNRAAMGEYPPGSTFKPLTLLAALSGGRVTPSTTFHCPGWFALGNSRLRCWNHWGHGTIDLPHAIRYSCNVYLCHAALAAGPEAIQDLARDFGFGRPTGITLDAERPGLVPTDAWKRARRHDAWRDGDTCNLSIGQGPILVTPLQLALYAAALANGGTLHRPRLVLSVAPPDAPPRAIPPAPADVQPKLRPAHVRVIREGMKDVVNAPDGTGRRAALPGITVAAKTGTAEYGPKTAGKKMTWMIAFAPFEKPRYAVALLVEDGVGGGATCGPRVQRLLARILTETEGRPVKLQPPPAPGNLVGPQLPAPGDLPPAPAIPAAVPPDPDAPLG